MAVIGLVNVHDVVHAWKAPLFDGLTAIVTFVVTLIVAPHLEWGILTGVVLSRCLTTLHRLGQCRYIAAIRFDGPLNFASCSYLEEAILTRVSEVPTLREASERTTGPRRNSSPCASYTTAPRQAKKSQTVLCDRPRVGLRRAPPSCERTPDGRTRYNTAVQTPDLTPREVIALVVAIGLCFAAAAVGSVATSFSVGGWYQTLAKPPWTPPNWVFGPVWTVLYAAMGVAAWLVWRTVTPVRQRALALFGLQLMLNVAWSWLFFAFRRIDLALVGIVLLWMAIALTIAAFARARRAASWLLVPYLAWVSFAAVLNAALLRLNS